MAPENFTAGWWGTVLFLLMVGSMWLCACLRERMSYYHLESRWRSPLPLVLVYHSPLEIATELGVAMRHLLFQHWKVPKGCKALPQELMDWWKKIQLPRCWWKPVVFEKETMDVLGWWSGRCMQWCNVTLNFFHNSFIFVSNVNSPTPQTCIGGPGILRHQGYTNPIDINSFSGIFRPFNWSGLEHFKHFFLLHPDGTFLCTFNPAFQRGSDHLNRSCAFLGRCLGLQTLRWQTRWKFAGLRGLGERGAKGFA